MAKRVQRRRGTTSEHSSFTGAVGEITVDTDKDTGVIHNGAQAGGFPLAREDMNNVTNAVGITQLNVSDGTNGQVLSTNGSGTLSFSTVDATTAVVGGDLSGTVGDAQIVADAVGTTELATDAVTTLKITDANVTDAKLATDSVTTVKITDANVTNAKIADSAVTSSKILDGTIVAGDIASNAVTAIKILDGNVTESKLATDSVTNVKIANDAVTNVKIANDAITATKIANDAITTVKIADNAITTALIAGGNVDGTKIALGSDTQGDVMYYDGTNWVRLPAGTSGYALVAGGTGANPSWSQRPYDMAFLAGFDKDMVKEDITVRTYGELVMARAGTFEGEAGYIDTPATIFSCIVDIEKNGSSIYSSRPEYASGSNSLTAGTLSVTTFAAGDRITFKITAIGSTVAGQGVRFTLKCKV